MNVKLLERVKEYILEEPRRLDMSILGEVIDPDAWHGNTEDIPPCNTVGCIAGWASILSRPDTVPLKERERVMDWHAGQMALELNFEQAQRLFVEPEWRVNHGDYGWPRDLAEKYVDADTPTERALVTAERIDRFIASNGTE